MSQAGFDWERRSDLAPPRPIATEALRLLESRGRRSQRGWEPEWAEGRPAPVLGPYHELTDEWLEGDREAPPKQRHTARRIWERLVTDDRSLDAELALDLVMRDKRSAGRQFVTSFLHRNLLPG